MVCTAVGALAGTSLDRVRTLVGMDATEHDRARAGVVVVRADDARCQELEATGYVIVGESWGARLRLAEPPDPSVLERALERVRTLGFDVAELDDDAAEALHALETANHPDYPFTPATAHEVRSPEGTRTLWTEGKRVFGALDGTELVAATVIERAENHGETLFTSVLAPYRGRGIGTAVKAASVVALASQGVRTFGTGGAGVNEASLGANRALGYVIEERWRSYSRDDADGRDATGLGAGPSHR